MTSFSPTMALLWMKRIIHILPIVSKKKKVANVTFVYMYDSSHLKGVPRFGRLSFFYKIWASLNLMVMIYFLSDLLHCFDRRLIWCSQKMDIGTSNFQNEVHKYWLRRFLECPDFKFSVRFWKFNPFRYWQIASPPDEWYS